MNKTFDGYTPNENSLLDLDRSDTHIHNILMPKDAKLIIIVQLIVALPFGSYRCKAHEETP